MDSKFENKRLAIKKAELEDINEILFIEKQCGLSGWKLEDYQIEINREGSSVLVAKIENKIIGFLTARSTADETDLLNIGVLSKYRKRGIGGLLLNNLLERVYETPLGTIWLEVRESNLEAIEFYRIKGFTQIQIRKNFYARPTESAILMRGDLKNLVSKF